MQHNITNLQPIADMLNKEIDAMELAKYIDNAYTNKIKVLGKEGIVIHETDEAEMYWLRNFRNRLMESKGVFFFED